MVWFNDSGLYYEVDSLVSTLEDTKFNANIETELDSEVINVLVINNYGEDNEQIYTTKTSIGFDTTPPTISSITMSNNTANTFSIIATDEGSNIMGYKLIESPVVCTPEDLTNLPITLTKSSTNKVCVYDNEKNLAEEVLDLAKITYIYEAPATVSSSYVIIDLDEEYELITQDSINLYSALGWFSGEDNITSIDQISSDIELTAKYKMDDADGPVINSAVMSNTTANVLSVSISDEVSGVNGWKLVESNAECTDSSLKSGTTLTAIVSASSQNKICAYDIAGNKTEKTLSLAKITYTYISPATASTSAIIVDTATGASISAPDDITYYTTNGWYNGDKKYSSLSEITGDIVLTASYTDKTNPTLTLSSINSTTGTIAGTMTDTGSGVYGYYYLGTSTGTCPTSTSSYTKSTSISKAVTTGGTHYFCAIDNDGNTSTVASYATIKVTYQNNGNTGSTNSGTYYYVKGTTASMLGLTTVTNYTAVGWQINGTTYTSLSGLAASTTTYNLVATYSLTFADKILTNDGDGYSTVSAATTAIAKKTPDFTKVATTNEGLNAIADNGGTSYYFRGAVDNNWVKFAGFYWRIIRIEGTGAIKLIYSGTTAPTSSQSVVMTGTGTQLSSTSTFQDTSLYLNDGVLLYKSAEGAGYVYQDSVLHGKTTDSKIKTAVDTWYSTNLSSYSSYLTTSNYCIDRVMYTRSGSAGSYIYTKSSSQTISTSDHYYGALSRLWYVADEQPSLECEDSGDVLSLSVGLIGADEVALAGGLVGSGNSSYYLYTNSTYWTLSPLYYYASIGSALTVNYNGQLGGGYIYMTSDLGVRPSVSLKSSISVSSGNGTWNNPYIVN